MTIAALTIQNIKTPSTNKRLFELKKNGLDVDIYTGIYDFKWMKNVLTKSAYLFFNFFLRTYQTIKITFSKKYKVVLIHKQFFEITPISRIFIKIIKKRKKIIFDFDDAIFLEKWDKGFTPWLTKNSDFVFVGSHELKKFAEKYSTKIELIPTSVDINYFKPKNKQKRKELTIGFLGWGPSHKNNLKIIREPIKKILTKYPNINFILIGAAGDKEIKKMFDFKEVKEQIKIIDSVPYNQVPIEINKFDVGLMPLIDEEWERHKCANKALEYMACNVIPIISAVGENKKVIQQGKNGFLANKSEDFFKIIERIYKSKDLDDIRKEARKTILEKYSTKIIVRKIQSTINYLETQK